jgi:hypothetical protein
LFDNKAPGSFTVPAHRRMHYGEAGSRDFPRLSFLIFFLYMQIVSGIMSVWKKFYL